jgi:hypothetical protein
MTTSLLRESTTVPLAKAGKRWRGVLAVPGKGSSGLYSEAVLREYGPKALAPGAKAFLEHDPTRPVKDMIGVYPDGAFYEEGVGLVGDLEVFPHWADFVEAVGPHAGLSIYMMGESDAEGNITSLLPDRQNGVDMVSYPGLEGSGLVEKLYEAAKASADNAENGTAPADRKTESKEITMEISELAGKVDKVLEGLTALTGTLTTLTESLKPAEILPEVADLGAVAEAAVKAGIPEEMRLEIYETAKEMTPTAATALVESRKKLVESIAKQITESGKIAPVVPAGRVIEGADKAFSLTSLAGA